MTKIEVTSVDELTGVVTVDSSFTYEEGETISVGDFITEGVNSTTHSELPDTCERYLIAYCKWAILSRDSSEDSQEALDTLSAIERDLVDSFADPDDDVQFIPEISEDY